MVLEATNHLYNHRIAKTQFLSIEPLLSWDTSHFSRPLTDSISKLDIDWLIIGACTGTLPDMTLLGERYPDLWLAGHGNKITAQPRIEWVREIVEAADKANVKVFLKDNLKPLLENEPLDPLYWANVCNDEAGNERVDDSLRQETPEKRIKEEVN